MNSLTKENFLDYITNRDFIFINNYEEFVSQSYSPMTNIDFINSIFLLNKYNIPYTLSPNSNYVWDGKILDFSKIRSFHILCHEIGHYISSLPSMRKNPNYGLGSSSEDLVFDLTENFDMKNQKENNLCHNYDILAGIIGIYLEYIHGKDISIAIGDLGWEVESKEKALIIVRFVLNLYFK